MTLTKMVDGQQIECSPEEEALIQNYWSLNIQYPKYKNALVFDWAHPAAYDMDQARKIHAEYLQSAVNAGINDITSQIEIAQESGQDTSSLFALRKEIRTCNSINLSVCQSPDDLQKSIPEILTPYWPS